MSYLIRRSPNWTAISWKPRSKPLTSSACGPCEDLTLSCNTNFTATPVLFVSRTSLVTPTSSAKFKARAGMCSTLWFSQWAKKNGMLLHGNCHDGPVERPHCLLYCPTLWSSIRACLGPTLIWWMPSSLWLGMAGWLIFQVLPLLNQGECLRCKCCQVFDMIVSRAWRPPGAHLPVEHRSSPTSTSRNPELTLG